MSKKVININDYKYLMFVDASGDDGLAFKETSDAGSSYSFVVSCFVTTPENYEYNKAVLLNAKKAMFVKPEQEIKSTALYRSRYADKVYAELSHLNGLAFSLIADKRLIQDCQPNENGNSIEQLTQLAKSDLSGITHTYPFLALDGSNLLSDHDKVLIILDNMKKREMDSVNNIIEHNFSHEKPDVIFRDSKDKNFPLIQIADIMAGTIRKYYESYTRLGVHNNYCKMCTQKAQSVLTNTSLVKACEQKNTKKFFKEPLNNIKFNTVIKLHQSETDDDALRFIILPIKRMVYFFYITCLLLGHKKRS